MPQTTLRTHRLEDRPHDSDRPVFTSRPERPMLAPHRSLLQKARVSVIVPVKNEAENLRRCLPALDWADEVIVVDSQSTDETACVAVDHGAHGDPVPLQRDLSQEEELGPRKPPVPQRVGPDRRRRRGRSAGTGRGDRPADRGRRGGRVLSSTRSTSSWAVASGIAVTPSAGTSGCSSTARPLRDACPRHRGPGPGTTRRTSTSS